MTTEDSDAIVEEGLDFDNEDKMVSNLTCLGIVGIQDPVRPEVRQSLSLSLSLSHSLSFPTLLSTNTHIHPGA